MPTRPEKGPILVIGASGFIGSALVGRLLMDGYPVVAAARGARRPADANGATWIQTDISRMTMADWTRRLAGVQAVVNCAGLLQGTSGETDRVHDTGPATLFAACQAGGVRRLIHISAIGVDRETPTAFSASKQRGEAALMATDLDWVILRPSVVVGEAAYGGSALFRGLAALPVFLDPPGSGELQIVQLDDLIETILRCLRPDAPARVAWDVAGPDRLVFREVVALYRRWLRWPAAPALRLPGWAAAFGYRLGDLAGWLGWRPPVRSVAGREILRGAVGDTLAWTRATGIEPCSLAQALLARPASVQERWFARLYLLKPVVFTVLPAFWIGTGIVSLTSGFGIGRAVMLEGGAGALSGPSVVAGALADIAIGVAIAFRPFARWGLWTAVGISLFYAAAGTTILPRLWADPLGPMLKIWPILVLLFMAMAILEDR